MNSEMNVKGENIMITTKQKQQAKTFKNMHTTKMIVLPNVWDAGSAYMFEKEGFKAVATSSAGISYSLGYPDGEDISIDDLVLRVQQITKRIDIPLSVDFERGYSEDIQEIKNNARRLLLSGAVGFNIEDDKRDGTLDELSYMIKKIEALQELKKEMDIDFIINARTGAFWLNTGDSEQMLETALERGNAFKNAGADCVFIPGKISEENVGKLVKGIDCSVNIILNPEFHDFQKLEKIGVSRLSVGSGPARSVFSYLKDLTEKMIDGDVEMMINHPFSYQEANNYFTK